MKIEFFCNENEIMIKNLLESENDRNFVKCIIEIQITCFKSLHMIAKKNRYQLARNVRFDRKEFEITEDCKLSDR